MWQAIELMRDNATEDGERGVIINVASMAGLLPMPMAPTYTATKHAVVGFSRAFSVRRMNERRRNEMKYGNFVFNAHTAPRTLIISFVDVSLQHLAGDGIRVNCLCPRLNEPANIR